MWEYFCRETYRVKRFRELKKKSSQEYMGQWQLESPAKEYLEQVKCFDDTDCTHRVKKQGFVAQKSGDWEEYKSIFRTDVKAAEWAFDRIKEAFEQVAQDEARKLSTVQEMMIRSTDYLRRTIAPVRRQGGVTMSHLRPHCNSFPFGRLHLVVLWGKKAHKLVVRKLWKKKDRKHANRLLVVPTGDSTKQAKVLEHMRTSGLVWKSD